MRLSVDSLLGVDDQRAPGLIAVDGGGMDLPPVTGTSFWGNWENPAWHHWIDLRFDASGEFYEQLRSVLPEDCAYALLRFPK